MKMSFWSIYVALGFALLVLSGCEEDVVAVLNAEVPFSMYGVLNPLEDTQYVRVFPIEGTLVPEDPAALEARFTSTHQGTGEVRVWQDTLIQIQDGTLSNVFYSVFRVEWGETYEVRVERLDGTASFATVTVPEQANLFVEPPDTTREVLLPAVVENSPANVIKTEVEVISKYVTEINQAGFPTFEFLNFTFSYDDRVRRSGNDWRVEVDLQEAFFDIQAEARRDFSFIESEGITLVLVSFSTVLGNEEWVPPDGEFNAANLIQPGTFSNVENGFGFVGAGYRLQRSWTLPFEVVEKTSFVPNDGVALP